MKFPVYACPKVRGVPVSILNGVPMAMGEPIVNRFVGDILQGLPNYIGIVSVGDPRAEDCTEVTELALRSPDVGVRFMFWVTDMATTGRYSFAQRLEILKPMVAAGSRQIQYVGWKKCADEAALAEYRVQILLAGHPDIEIRDDGVSVKKVLSASTSHSAMAGAKLQELTHGAQEAEVDPFWNSDAVRKRDGAEPKLPPYYNRTDARPRRS